uniref:RING-type E3 ubiquitin transferase n=1 Tax=Rhizophora mucronata TaxID=61149 RepID=A0A2P2NFI8_RHIMU
MDWVFLQIKDNTFLAPSQQPYVLSQPPPQQKIDSDGFNLDNKVSPSILLIIIILAIIFFVSGLLHLLVRVFLRQTTREPDDSDNVTARQGQLQQLFHLHDSGVEQSFIDTIPVFQYKTIIGLKNPFDCAVCLCEFEPEDKLRLLPQCSHAFHTECIDTWLLSHSTCPLCRTSLLPDSSPNSSYSPIVIVLESGSESSREIANEREGTIGGTNSLLTTNSHLSCNRDNELGSSRIDISRKSCEIVTKDDLSPTTTVGSEEKIVLVKLGKFRNVNTGEGSSNSNVDARRCFSMGSFEYVMDENSSLRVPIRTPSRKPPSKKPSLPLTPGHRPAMSECDCESKREFHGFEGIKSFETNDSARIVGVGGTSGANAIGRSKRESFSISKIWLWGKNQKPNPTQDSSRRAFSSRFPVNKNAIIADEDLKMKNVDGGARRTFSEMGIERWGNGGSELGCDEESQSRISLDSQTKTPSFTRRTLLWLVGRQNKIGHSSFTTIV